MTLTKGADAYAEKHGRDENDKARLRDAYRAGYLQSTENWCKQSRD